jgi:predicted TIM-barrel fold metal-dependent hydrolase
MDSDLLFKYVVKQGETLQRIAKRFKVPDEMIIYEHSSNADFRKKYPDPKSIQAGDILTIPAGNVVPSPSGQKTTVAQSGVRVLFDGHMHIQSNNCAPLTIQWACVPSLTRGSLPYLPGQRATRKDVADLGSTRVVSMFTGRLAPIGRLPTDLIAKLYMNALEDKDMRSDAAWIVLEKNESYNSDKNSEYGKRAKLTDMEQDSAQKYEKFESALRPYFGVPATYKMLGCCQTFDLTFAHFWGRFGIPVNIPLGNNFYFINDYVQAGMIGEMIAVSPNVVAPESAVDIPASFGYMDASPAKKLFHLYAAKFPNSNEVFSFPDQFQRFSDAVSTETRLAPQGHRYPWFFMHFEGNKNTVSQLVNRKYVHLVEPHFAEETKWCEDFFNTQLPLSEGAAINAPLQLLLFYHYDPRRYVPGNNAGKAAAIQALAAKIVEHHAFFSFREEQDLNKVEFANDIKMSGKMVLTPMDSLNTQAAWEKILSDLVASNQSVFSKLIQCNNTGIYWGIKIYPRLGYDPADWGADRYPQLTELYKTCVEKNIPMLAHCSKGGMAIADYYNYIRYDKLSQNDEEYEPGKADETFADSFAAPANWRKVLDRYPKLKLCLAHFGGYDVWKESGNFQDLDLTPPNPASEQKNWKKFHNYQHWVRDIAEIIQEPKYGNVYTDLSCFVLEETFDERKHYSDNLVYLLGKYKKLKERLLIGTDWPMIEMSPVWPWKEKLEGVGIYMTRMMLVLREVSRQVGYDAWHQFGVINQLRYLGLLDESGEEMKVKIKMLEDYKERLNNYYNAQKAKKPNWENRAHISISGFDQKAQTIIDAFKIATVMPMASEIKRNGELSILSF